MILRCLSRISYIVTFFFQKLSANNEIVSDIKTIIINYCNFLYLRVKIKRQT